MSLPRALANVPAPSAHGTQKALGWMRPRIAASSSSSPCTSIPFINTASRNGSFAGIPITPYSPVPKAANPAQALRANSKPEDANATPTESSKCSFARSRTAAGIDSYASPTTNSASNSAMVGCESGMSFTRV